MNYETIETLLTAGPPEGAERGYGAHPLLNYGSPPQEVLTPPWLAARMARAFGDHIALDPTAPSLSEPSFFAERYVREAEDGLSIPWVDRTYVNPPFDNLQPWLLKASAEAQRGIRVVVLAPFRSHRSWFRTALLSAKRATLLDGVAFVGHSSPFPAPLALLTWNCVVTVPTDALLARFSESPYTEGP